MSIETRRVRDATAAIPRGGSRAELLREREAICDAIRAAQSTDYYDAGVEACESRNQVRLRDIDAALKESDAGK